MANVGLYIQQMDFSKVFLSGVTTEVWNYTNPTGTPITFNAGTIFGVIPGTPGTVRDCQSGSSDGSQMPYGALLNYGAITVAGNATVAVTLGVAGYINQANIVFSNGTDTLNTAVVNGGVTLGTMHTLMTKGGLFPVVDTVGDYADNS